VAKVPARLLEAVSWLVALLRVAGPLPVRVQGWRPVVGLQQG
jgi:hypothetical protein